MFPAPYKVKRIRREQTGENALGQPIYSDDPSIKAIAVHYLEPVSMEERHTAALAGRTVSDYRLGSPTDSFRNGDEVEFRGVTYEVHGEVEDYTVGPFVPGFGGFVVGLRMVTNSNG